MAKRVFVLAAVFCLALAAQPAQAQVAVVTVRSVESVLSDAKYVLKLAGQEDLSQQLDGMLGLLGDGKGIPGVDAKKPLGIYVLEPKNGAPLPPIVGFIPITKEKDFFDALAKLKLEVSEPDGKGIRSIDAPGVTLYLRAANGHLYASNEKSHIEGKLQDPADLLLPINKTSLFAASIRFDRFPKELKETAIAAMKQEGQKELKKKPGESETEFQARLAGTKWIVEGMTTVVQDAMDLTFSLQIDQKAQKIVLDHSLSAKPDTPLAAQFKSFGQQRSRFAGLARDAAIEYVMTFPISEELLKILDQGVEDGFKKQKDAAKRAADEESYKAFRKLLRTDVVDWAAFLYGPDPDKLYSLLFAGHVKSGPDAENGLRDFLKLTAKEERVTLKLDHTKIGATAVHAVIRKKDKSADKVFGSDELLVARHEDVLLVTMGNNGTEVMKEALAKLNQPAPKDIAPIQIQVSLSKLAGLSTETTKKYTDALAKVFAGRDKDKDKIRFSIQGGDAVRVRFEMDAAIIKLISMLKSAKDES